MLHYIYLSAVECIHVFRNSESLESEGCSAGWDVLSVGYISVPLQCNAPSPFEVGGQWDWDEVLQQSSYLIQFPEMTKGNTPSDMFYAQWSQPPRAWPIASEDLSKAEFQNVLVVVMNVKFLMPLWNEM